MGNGYRATFVLGAIWAMPLAIYFGYSAYADGAAVPAIMRILAISILGGWIWGAAMWLTVFGPLKARQKSQGK